MNENETKQELIQQEKKEIVTEKEKVENVNNKKGSNISLIIKGLIFGIVVGFLGCIVFYYGVKNEVNNNQEKSKINIDYITGTIKEMSDLISAELDFSNIYEHETQKNEKGLAFIEDLKQDKFWVRYDAEIKAGIDLKEIEISQIDEKIIVTMPHAKIKFKKVLPETIKIYDIKKAWGVFGNDKKKEMIDALVKCEEDMDKSVDLEKLQKNAEEQAIKLIGGIINGIDSECQIEYRFKNQDVIKDNLSQGE